jgi:hypothetical protein
MNTLRKIFVSITAIALLFLTSCLDDKDITEFNGVMTPDFAGSPNVVDFNEMPNSAGYIIRTFPGTVDPNQSYPSNFRVNLSSPWQLDHDITLTIALDDAAANSYIADNPGFVLFPSNKHTFTSTTVTIPAGEREVELPIDFFSEGLSADDKFMMAISITDVSDPNVIISGNFGTQYIKVGVTNLFHGTYDVDAFWHYKGTTDYSFLAKTPVDFGTLSSRGILTDYTYAGWGQFEFTVDLDNPQTIEGHAGAMKVSVILIGIGDANEQVDAYNGEVWNYCYMDAGKWHFKICHIYNGSGPHFSANWYHQQ